MNFQNGGDVTPATSKYVSTPIDDQVAPFPRLCQASIRMGKVLKHLYGDNPVPETVKHTQATELFVEIQSFADQVNIQAHNAKSILPFAAPLALAFTALCALCEAHLRPSVKSSHAGGSDAIGPESVAMQGQSLNDMKAVTTEIVKFAVDINRAISASPQALGEVSPIIMGALYSAAKCDSTVLESKGQSNQAASDVLSSCLKALEPRWRNAANYARTLDGRVLAYAVPGSS